MRSAPCVMRGSVELKTCKKYFSQCIFIIDKIITYGILEPANLNKIFPFSRLKDFLEVYYKRHEVDLEFDHLPHLGETVEENFT